MMNPAHLGHRAALSESSVMRFNTPRIGSKMLSSFEGDSGSGDGAGLACGGGPTRNRDSSRRFPRRLHRASVNPT